MDELTITVKIAGRDYKLFISRDEEQSVREAASKVEEQIQSYANSYHSDKQDILAMVALHFASLGLRTGTELAYLDGKMSSDLAIIDNILDSTLKIDG